MIIQSANPIAAIFYKALQMIDWRDLEDDSVWRQGWV